VARLFRRPVLTPEAAAYRAAPVAPGWTPWRRAGFCVVDLELSGLDPARDEIISFAAVPVDGGVVGAGRAIEGLCRPTQPLTEPSVLIHGLRTVDLAAAPPLDVAVGPLLAAMAGRVLVAHVAWVERRFLGAAWDRQGLRLRGPVVDTLAMARLWAARRGEPAPDEDLGTLARRLGLPVHRPHVAMGDALTTAQVFIALAALLERDRPETVSSLAHAPERAGLEAM